MDVRLIRNATLRLDYGGQRFLIDPMLSVRNAIRPMGDSPERNPTVELPVSVDEVLADVDTVLVSHLHPDHWDDAATGLVPRTLPMVCQPGDEEKLGSIGFTPRVLDAPITVGDVEITPTDGEHGHGEVLEKMGAATGFLLRAPGEPTLYWVGDTVLCDPVRDVIATEAPEVIITHSGGARYGGDTILMDVAETLDVAALAPDAVVIAVHLEAVAHAPVTRAGLRSAADAAGVSPARLVIPADGETVHVGAPAPVR
jgi:L-ascorbate metabolism protein UlaG (beta-lactamase superfamily)